ncbi:hypothetical protein FQR65_LT05283 [Abscondita terminalis]|nr:hypothetical protein FQR65_LT05283 [Abscondita terminalis]
MTFPSISLPTKKQQAQQDALEKSEKLEQLDEKICELERFIQFSEVNKLLEESEEQRQNVKNIYLIDVTINKINKLIWELSHPFQCKLEQLKFLRTLIEKYFDQSEVDSINGALTIHLKKLQKELDSFVINKDEIDKKIIDCDQIIASKQKKILGKMFAYLQNKEVICNYVEYKSKIIEYYSDQEENEPKNINDFFQKIESLEASIIEFDISFQAFQERLTCLSHYDGKFNNAKLVESNDIEKIKSEILVLLETIKSFNPLEKSFAILDDELSSLSQRLEDLYQLNHAELQKQQCNLLDLIKISKENLTEHVDGKLSRSTSKCAASKRDKINRINTKINALINNEINPEDDVIDSRMIDNISELKQTIKEAKTILSEYRGISLLRCFATLWGGGKMRIFDLDTLLSFAFYPDGNKKLKRTSQEYRLNIDQYCKNASKFLNDKTHKDFLIDMKVICLGLVKKKFKKLEHEITFKKIQIMEKGNFLIEKEFCTPDSNKPYPLLILYKKKLGIPKKNQLFDLLKPFFTKIIKIHSEKNDLLKQLNTEETVISINSEYQNKVTEIAKDIFKELKNTREDINIIGLFIDPYFVRKNYNDFVLTDTRPVDTLPRKKNGIQPELSFENNDNQAAMHLETQGSANKDNNADEEIWLLERLFAELIDNEITNAYKVSEEVNENISNRVQPDSSATKFDSTIDNTFVVSETNSFAWNFETKEKIENLLKDYQKHLHKNRFFYAENTTKSKLATTNDLLDKLNKPSCQAFFHQIRQEATTDVLNKHRNFLFFPILSYLFNYNKKTRGQLLLDNLLANFSENIATINFKTV